MWVLSNLIKPMWVLNLCEIHLPFRVVPKKVDFKDQRSTDLLQLPNACDRIEECDDSPYNVTDTKPVGSIFVWLVYFLGLFTNNKAKEWKISQTSVQLLQTKRVSAMRWHFWKRLCLQVRSDVREQFRRRGRIDQLRYGYTIDWSLIFVPPQIDLWSLTSFRSDARRSNFLSTRWQVRKEAAPAHLSLLQVDLWNLIFDLCQANR